MPFWLKTVIVLLGLGCAVYSFWREYKENKGHLVVCKNEEETKQYMKNWIQNDGKVCVMSRDLSWVDAEIEGIMYQKADNLKLFVQKETELTKRLQERHVIIYYYGKFGFEPQSRFTIIRANRPERQIAIASTTSSLASARNWKRGYRHQIYQTDIKGGLREGWILSLAEDLTRICEAIYKTQEREKS